MTVLPFTKMHGNGNDFVVINIDNLPEQNLSWNDLAQKICDRHFGIGADQVLLVSSAQNQNHADFKMDIYDADGSHVEMCGNGLRTIALYLIEEKLTSSDEIKVALMERTATVKRASNDRFQVNLGEPILEGREIPVNMQGKVINHQLTIENNTYEMTCVSMGNPHAVIFTNEDLKTLPLARIGPMIEQNDFFPNRTNVEFVSIQNPEKAQVRVWERGTGETLACGSGACAVTVAGVITERLSRNVQLQLPGGLLEVFWNAQDNSVYLTGDAKRVYDGKIDLEEFKS